MGVETQVDFLDEGVLLKRGKKLDMAGAGVTGSVSGEKVIETIPGGGGGATDHGALTGLLDDDHPQYLKEEASGGLASEIPDHLHTGAAEAGTLDHGLALTGLTDDDHTQYQQESEKAAASGYASLDSSALVPVAQLGTGTPDGTKFLRDDRTWQTPSGAANPEAALDLVDEFMAGSVEDGELGDLGWGVSGGVADTPSVANHIGVVRLSTSATISTARRIYLGHADATSDLLLAVDLWDMTFIVKTGASITSVRIAIGAKASLNNAPGTNEDKACFEFSTFVSDVYWMKVTNTGASETRTASAVTVAVSTWYKLRIQRTATGVKFYIDGSQDGAEVTLTLPDDPMNVGVYIRNDASEDKTLDVDYFRLQQSGLTR